MSHQATRGKFTPPRAIDKFMISFQLTALPDVVLYAYNKLKETICDLKQYNRQNSRLELEHEIAICAIYGKLEKQALIHSVS